MIRNREQIQNHHDLQRIYLHTIKKQRPSETLFTKLRTVGKGVSLITLGLTPASSLQTFPEISTWLPTSLVARQEEKLSTEYRVAPRAVVDVNLHHGSIKIETWNKPFVVVNVTKNARTPEELTATGIKVEHSELKLALNAEQPPQTLLHATLIVPATATVTVKIETGPITVTSAPRHLTAHTETGTIDITTYTDGSIKAQTEKGDVTIVCEAFSPTSSLFVTAPHGAITVKVPPTTKAHLNARSIKGTIKSQLPITFDPFTTAIRKNTWKELQRNIKGTFGDSDAVAPITLSAYGNIIIIEHKA